MSYKIDIFSGGKNVSEIWPHIIPPSLEPSISFLWYCFSGGCKYAHIADLSTSLEKGYFFLSNSYNCFLLNSTHQSVKFTYMVSSVARTGASVPSHHFLVRSRIGNKSEQYIRTDWHPTHVRPNKNNQNLFPNINYWRCFFISPPIRARVGGHTSYVQS